MEREMFADGIGEISLVAGMVRIDWVSLSGTKKDASGQPAIETRQRMVLPPEGFLRAYSAMEDLVQHLVDAGVIRKNENSAPTIKS